MITRNLIAVLSLLLTTLIASGQSEPGEKFKVGMINIDKILLESTLGKAARTSFDEQLKTFQKSLDDEQARIQAESKTFQEERSKMTPEAAEKREREFQQQFSKLQSSYQQLEANLAQQRSMLTQQVMMKARSIISEVSNEYGLEIVLDQSSVIWTKSSVIDISDEVIKRIK